MFEKVCWMCVFMTNVGMMCALHFDVRVHFKDIFITIDVSE